MVNRVVLIPITILIVWVFKESFIYPMTRSIGVAGGEILLRAVDSLSSTQLLNHGIEIIICIQVGKLVYKYQTRLKTLYPIFNKSTIRYGNKTDARMTTESVFYIYI